MSIVNKKINNKKYEKILTRADCPKTSAAVAQ
jgi:hypothetical protein